MSVIEYPVGEEVELELVYKINDLTVSGLTVNVSLRRTDDNYYFDFADNTWKPYSSVITPAVQLNDIGDGVYQRKWDSTYVGAVPRQVVASYEVTSAGYEAIAEDTLMFGVSSVDPASVAQAVWSKNPIPFVGTPTFGGMMNDISDKVAFIKDVEEGRWRIENNQMIFYKADNTTEIMRFALFDITGAHTMDSVAERRRL